MGIDGAEAMIAKAKTIDEKTDYIHALLPEYQPIVNSILFIQWSSCIT